MKKSATTIIFLAMFAFCFAMLHEKKNAERSYEKSLSVIQSQKDALVINEEILNSLSQENEELKDEIDNFKKVESVTEITTDARVDTVFVQYDSIIHVSDDGSFSGRVDIDSTYYSLSCRFTEKAFTLERLRVPNMSRIIIGDKKIKGWTGITKGKEYTLTVHNSNPYVKTVDIRTYKIVEEKKWYETRGFAIGAGLVGGFLLAK